MSPSYTTADLAEQAGAQIATTALDAILAQKTQAARAAQLCTALQQLSENCDHRDRAIAGFAGVIVNVVEQGLGVAA
nr:hypothetical protein [uncultured Albidiferax sp.]